MARRIPHARMAPVEPGAERARIGIGGEEPAARSQEVEAAAERMTGAGVRSGDRVALLAPNMVEWVVLFLAGL